VSRFSERVYFVFCGLLLIVGSLLSANGGRQHPTISNHLGGFGSPPFFRAFASLIASEPKWEPVHAQIMAAPVLWVLGGLALAAIARAAGEARWSGLAVVSMTIGATLWVVQYIFDGFVADHTAAWLLGADPSTAPQYSAIFGANQWVSIRTSMVSWLLVAFGTTAFSIALAPLARRGAGRGRPLAVFLVVYGLILGAWTLGCAVTGVFLPGPMVSPYYVPVLVGTQFWYLFAGVFLIYRTVRRPRPAASTEAEREPVPAREPAHAAS
jgi:hypothetical protein